MVILTVGPFHNPFWSDRVVGGSDSVFSLQYGCHMEATAADFAQELLLLLRAVITMGIGLTPVAHLLPIQVLLNLRRVGNKDPGFTPSQTWLKSPVRPSKVPHVPDPSGAGTTTDLFQARNGSAGRT